MGRPILQFLERKCIECHLVKPYKEFLQGKAHSKSRICNKCTWRRHWKKTKERAEVDPDYKLKFRRRTYKSELKNNYNMTLEEYDTLFKKQNGLCAICGQKEKLSNGYTSYRLAVDHSHITKKVRGLLCRGCNQGLGNFNENVDRLAKAIIYLQESKGDKK